MRTSGVFAFGPPGPLGDVGGGYLTPRAPEKTPLTAPVEISVVVPIYDEEQNLRPLHEEIARSLGAFGRTWEVIFVDDCSDDGSPEVLVQLWREDPHVRVVRFRGRSGQTAAMAAGFDNARGEIVITLDGDLQNDPADIPALIEELERGYDVVAGWRKSRQDGFILRRLPSMIANRLIALVTGVSIHDTGCTLKAFRRELIEKLPIYAEQHRFLPAMSAGSGARVSELVVNHRPRLFGKSKYGISRALRVLLDLLVVKMIASFSRRPLQYFGLLVLPFALMMIVFVAGALASAEPISFDNRWGRAIVLSFVMLFMACVYFVLLGLLAELVVNASGLHRSRGAGRILVTSVDR